VAVCGHPPPVFRLVEFVFSIVRCSSTELTVHFLIDNSLQKRFVIHPYFENKFNKTFYFLARKRHVYQQIGEKKTEQNEYKS